MNNKVITARGAGCLIRNEKGEYLIQDHVKHNLLTCPLGWVEAGEHAQSAIVRELWEELGISAIVRYYGSEEVNIKGEWTEHTLFNLESYSGEIMNKEPHKHRSLTWMSRAELLSSERPLSMMLQFGLKLDGLHKQ